ncbi:MAG TPA: cyclic nucleotide-binding domain-containing protein [Hyphomicrobiaceae bacterium]|nr:cyclic nucleotide-binding domain-containing protein [Hyphomicrobiaceae bacterium]
MAKDALIRALRQIALFDGLTPLQITEIARRADRIVYRPGQTMITAHQPTDAAVVIFSGTAERTSGPGLERVPQLLPAGTIIAEMAMLIDLVPGSTVIAQTEVRALRLTRSEMHRLIAEDPALGEHFIGKATARLKGIARKMRDIDTDLATLLERDRQDSPHNAESLKTQAPSHH